LRWPEFLRKAVAPLVKLPMPRQQFANVVFFTADARYLQLGWLAARAAAAEPDRNFDVVLLVMQGDGAAALPAPPGCQMLKITLPGWLERWPVPAHMSIASYARLFAADSWLRGWDKALYLDADVFIEGRLAPLFGVDLNGALAALVEDCGYCRYDEAAAAWRAGMLAQIGLDPAATYFNAGVILFDVAGWRAARVTAALAAFKDVQSKISGAMDQDFVNFVVRGRALTLSLRWNFQTHFFGLGLEPVVAPVVTHYLDILKPWRDPEWPEVYDPLHVERFSRLLAADTVFGPGLSPGLRARAHPDAVFATHVANVLNERAEVRSRVVRRIAASAADYADLAPAERKAWAAL
jgi:lipopolysaccharide biosynthesis glycosyltransferase